MIRPNDNRYLPLNFVSKNFKVPDLKSITEARSTDRIIRKIVKKLKIMFWEYFQTGFRLLPSLLQS